MDNTRTRMGEALGPFAGARLWRVARRGALIASASAWTVLASACGDSQGGGQIPPPDVKCPEAQVPLCDPAISSVVLDASSDSRTRSLEGLENATARSAIATSLDQLHSALSAGNVTVALRGLESSRTALTAANAQSAAFAGDAADLMGIELFLDHVTPLLR